MNNIYDFSRAVVDGKRAFRIYRGNFEDVRYTLAKGLDACKSKYANSRKDWVFEEISLEEYLEWMMQHRWWIYSNMYKEED